MSSNLQRLRATLEQISAITQSVASEKNRAAAVTSYLGSLRVGSDQYGNRTIPDILVSVANTVNGRIKAELIAEVERRHAADLVERAKQLEALRAVIPGLAAKAAIEIGETARRLHLEAPDA